MVLTDTGRFLALHGLRQGDLDFDHLVNIWDINAVSSGWGSQGYYKDGDSNLDATVNIFDINMVTSKWVTSPYSDPVATPTLTLRLYEAGTNGYAVYQSDNASVSLKPRLTINQTPRASAHK